MFVALLTQRQAVVAATLPNHRLNSAGAWPSEARQELRWSALLQRQASGSTAQQKMFYSISRDTKAGPPFVQTFQIKELRWPADARCIAFDYLYCVIMQRVQPSVAGTVGDARSWLLGALQVVAQLRHYWGPPAAGQCLQMCEECNKHCMNGRLAPWYCSSQYSCIT